VTALLLKNKVKAPREVEKTYCTVFETTHIPNIEDSLNYGVLPHMMRTRPASVTLTIHPASWRPPRSPTPRRVTFPLPYTTSTLLSPIVSCTPTVPALSYWIPDTPSPSSSEHPSSPVNPFLVPPQAHSLFRLASPLIPVSPLSLFDYAMSPGYFVSLMGSMCAVEMSPMSPTFLFSPSATTTPTQQTFPVSLLSPKGTFLLPMSPISPSFMYPRTPPCPRQMEVKMRPKVLAVEAAISRRKSVHYALEDIMGRKASIARVFSMEQERMNMKINFYQWLAIRRWEGMEKKEKKHGWRMWGSKLWGKKKGKKQKAKGFNTVKDVVGCV
jgi:hypothetical protein